MPLRNGFATCRLPQRSMNCKKEYQSAERNDSTILEGYTMDDVDADTLER